MQQALATAIVPRPRPRPLPGFCQNALVSLSAFKRMIKIKQLSYVRQTFLLLQRDFCAN